MQPCASTHLKLAYVFLSIAIFATATFAQSGSNRKIAFRYGGSAFSSTITVINEDGSGQVQLTNVGFNDNNPTWSPDGSQIAFDSDRYGSTINIFRMNADGTGRVPLTNSLSPTADSEPAWSPDATKIAFVSNRSGTGRSEIWAMRADGTDFVRLTTNVQFGSNFSRDNNPRWSPDGSKIVFWSNRDGLANPEIYSMNADGSNPIRLTNNADDDRNPTWSSDGQHIAFSRQVSGTTSIYEIDQNGANERFITSGFQPSYAPAGVKMTVGDRDPQAALAIAVYLVNVDGSNRTRLTNNGMVDSYAAVWQTTGGPAPPPPPPPPVFSVSGHVSDSGPMPHPPGVAGITMTISGTVSAMTTTDADGNYFLGNLPENGTFTLTPSSPDWRFIPASRAFDTFSPLSGFVGRNLDVQFDAVPVLLRFPFASNSGTEGTNVIITVERTGDVTRTSRVDYATSNGSAVAGIDYVATTGTLQFNPSESSKTFSVPIIYDKIPEPDETINLTLSNPTGGFIRGDQTAVITISDAPPQLIRAGNSSRAAALNAETWLPDPFPLTTTSFLAQNAPTRVALFANFVDLLPTESASAVTVTAVDSHQTSYVLTTEFVGKVPYFDWLTQVNVILPANLPSGDLSVTISLRGLTSNSVLISIR